MQVESLEKAMHEYGFLPRGHSLDSTLCEPGKNIRWVAYFKEFLLTTDRKYHEEMRVRKKVIDSRHQTKENYNEYCS